MTQITKNTIKVWGRFHTLFGDTPETVMADMLRYDQADICDLEIKSDNGTTGEFEAFLVSNGYTPRRWQSFGLCCELIKGNFNARLAEIDFRGVDPNAN